MLSKIGVRRLVGKVCRDMGRTPPPIEFGDADCAGFHRASNLIILPSPAWVKENKEELRVKSGTALGYRLVVLHETAHFLSTPGHNGKFYALLFFLCELYGVPLSLAFHDELEYKGRSAARGIELYLEEMRGAKDD